MGDSSEVDQADQTQDEKRAEEGVGRCVGTHSALDHQQTLEGIRKPVGALSGEWQRVNFDSALALHEAIRQEGHFRRKSVIRSVNAREDERFIQDCLAGGPRWKFLEQK
jgi:hypothetical protein